MNTLSEILQVSPLDERRCLGSSPQGRCENDIPAARRAIAWDFLRQESRRVEQDGGIWIGPAGLIPVAKLLLCYSHQEQVSGFVHGWMTRLEEWERSRQERQRPSTLLPPPAVRLRPWSSVLSLPLTTRDEFESFAPSYPHYSSLDSSEAISSSPPSARPAMNPVSTRSALLGAMSSFSGSPSPSDQDSPLVAYPVTPSPSLSSSATSTTTTTTIPTATKSRYNVNRRQIEGDCGICILPFSVDPNARRLTDADGDTPMDGECDVLESESHDDGTSDTEPEEDEDPDDYEECDEDDDNESDDEDAVDMHYRAESDTDDDIVWCKVKCGTNYHRSCLNTWIETFKNEAFRRPTCPSCRALWRE